MRYHMGCGEQRIEGYVGVDIRRTDVAEIVTDLNEPKLPEGQLADVFFSHAFFEHLRRDSRATHLRALRDGLAPGGIACYIGLPDFRRIAELYLEGGPGVVGPTFDLPRPPGAQLAQGSPRRRGAARAQASRLTATAAPCSARPGR